MSSIKKKTVLVADDSDLVLEETCNVLTEYGFDVVQATDGEKVLEICDHISVDIALIDLIMPLKDGIEVYEILRATKPHIVVILTSVAALPAWFQAKYPECKFIPKSHLFSRLPAKLLVVEADSAIHRTNSNHLNSVN